MNPSRPDPPSNSEFASTYEEGDKVYYYRHKRWRLAEVQKAESSGKRYALKDLEKQDTYHADISDMRKQVQKADETSNM